MKLTYLVQKIDVHVYRVKINNVSDLDNKGYIMYLRHGYLS